MRHLGMESIYKKDKCHKSILLISHFSNWIPHYHQNI